MYLLDTNTLSELFRKLPNPQFLQRLRGHRAQAFFTSVICGMELRHGNSRPPGREAKPIPHLRVENWLE